MCSFSVEHWDIKLKRFPFFLIYLSMADSLSYFVSKFALFMSKLLNYVSWNLSWLCSWHTRVHLTIAVLDQISKFKRPCMEVLTILPSHSKSPHHFSEVLLMVRLWEHTWSGCQLTPLNFRMHFLTSDFNELFIVLLDLPNRR